jgi:hypothetical protein
MKARYSLDLLHPGRNTETWRQWFLGARGLERLAAAAVLAVAVVALPLAAGILPAYWRLSGEAREVATLRSRLTATEAEARALKTTLAVLGAEARKQVRWADLLNTLSREAPPNLKLQRVEFAKPAPAPRAGREPQQAASAAGALQIEALTPVRPGPPPLVEIARFMAGLMRDPATNRRFQLNSWEIKPAPRAADGASLLQIHISLGERPR